MKRPVQEYYDRNAQKRYEKRGSVDQTTDSYEELLAHFMKLVKDGGDVLDCGCGVGKDTRYFRRNGLSCIGMDISSAQLDFVDTPVVLGDMSDMPIKNNVLDGVWCPNAIFYLELENIISAVREFKRVVGNEGCIAVGFKIGDDTCKKYIERYGERLQYLQFTHEKSREILESSGLSIRDKRVQEVGDRTFKTYYCYF